jgi:demethylmenaquinone methyltransferase/2-methoxy-6-polyprenyl-1,4-benzoquinol methylase
LQERIKSSPQALTIGLDLSREMLRTARKRLIPTEDSSAPDLLQGSGAALPLVSDSIDTIFCSFTLELFDTPLLPQVLEEIHRALKPGGRLGVVSLSRDHKLPPAGRIYDHLHNWFPTWIDCRPIPIRTLLQEAGFTIQQEERKLMWGLPVSQVAAVSDRV